MAGFYTKTFSKHDDYMTPDSAWENIKQYIPKDKIIWEAFYGDGNSGRYLDSMGLKQVIHKDEDFFTSNPNYDMICTNPPFGKIKPIMERLKILDKPFIMIMPVSKIGTNYFKQFVKELKPHEFQIIIPRRRIQFIKLVDGKVPNDYKSDCNFDCFYYCYKMNLPNDIIFLE
tara:strand:- start:696 stop:1211 length:516 start_codon:yes stop_codon:yes gene_type:complete